MTLGIVDAIAAGMLIYVVRTELPCVSICP
jgi:hypothetical protein